MSRSVHQRQDTLLLVACVSASAALSVVGQESERRETGLPDEPGLVVCIIDFENLKPHKDLDYLSRAIAESLTSRLAGLGMWRVVERSRLQDVMNELKLRTTDLVDERTIAEIGKILGASHILVGSYRVTLFPERRTINVRLVEVETALVRDGGAFTGSDQADIELKVLEWLAKRLPRFSYVGDAYHRGLSLLADRKYGDAFFLLWQALENSPEDVVLHRIVHDCARKAELAAELLKRYQALVKAHPDSAAVHNYLGNALLLVDPKDTVGRAAAEYRRTLELDLSFAPPVNNLAAIELNRKNYQDALRGFRSYIEKAPADAEGWVNLGNCCVDWIRSHTSSPDVSLDEEAEQAFLRAIEIDPGLGRAWRGLGALSEHRRDWINAVRAYRAVLRLDRAQGDVRSRLDELNKKISTDPTDRLESMLRLPAGLRALAKRPFDRAALCAGYTQALHLRAQDKYGAAIDLCVTALSRDSQNALGWLLQADLCLRAGRKEKAADALRKATNARRTVRNMVLYKRLASEIEEQR